MFSGTYHGKKAHEDDLDDVIQRARDVGCAKFMVTGSDLEESARAVDIARKYRASSFFLPSLDRKHGANKWFKRVSAMLLSVCTPAKRSFSTSIPAGRQKCSRSCERWPLNLKPQG